MVAAQEEKLMGVITDNQGNSVAEAHVYALNQQTSTKTNFKGEFSIKVESTDTLYVQSERFTDAKIVVNPSKKVSITLLQKNYTLDEVILTQKENPLEVISGYDVAINPVKSSQEVLRLVPGLFIAQHAGGGKAEQIFLRGFDIDHGTDIALDVDGIPVNMVSHAHGQGYSDLHFVIPETIQNIDFGKGPHKADRGNFATAGYASMNTIDQVYTNTFKQEIGEFNTFRTLGLFGINGEKSESHTVLSAEYLSSNGAFESPQNFNRVNVFGKFTIPLSASDQLTLTSSYFSSEWDASGQIPVRAVQDGTISRFGAIDDTEGGETSRFNTSIQYRTFLADDSMLKASAYYSAYEFGLYSNFTFFLNNPEVGDQIFQQENRNLFGGKLSWQKDLLILDVDAEFTAGIGVRSDYVEDSELSETINRTTINLRRSLGDIRETNSFSYVKLAYKPSKFTITPSLRLDYFSNTYTNALEDNITATQQKAMLNPKLSIGYAANPQTDLFLKAGTGFHSNDTRVVVAQSGQTILPRAYGVDAGLNLKPTPKLFINSTLWYLGLDQEFVYVGDEGVVEPSGRTRRFGADLTTRYQLSEVLFLDSDFTYSHARSLEAEDGEDYIPLAPQFAASGGLTLKAFKNFSGSIRSRLLTDRPADESNTIKADGYFITDFTANYTWKRFELGVIVENIFDREWNEAQFLTNSRLQNEAVAVEEIHFTPGNPINVRTRLTYTF
ncbi:TonB-dependent receptor [Gangjinia marincola]|uniref:TonB-dependent receptor n=2 Tax=Gangjinia marincola TaxID=578463 RepID=A0ABN1MJ63_9FLAO